MRTALPIKFPQGPNITSGALGRQGKGLPTEPTATNPFLSAHAIAEHEQLSPCDASELRPHAL